MVTQSYNDILTKMKNLMIANQDKLTDFNEGSIILTQFEVIANILERFYVDTRNGYTQSLKDIAYSIFDFKKKSGAKATTNVVFSRSSASPIESNIPIGTKVSDGTYQFVTTAAGKILADATQSNSIPVQAVEVGLDYNIAANTLTTIESVLASDIVSVTNPLKANGGSNEETETEVLSRFKTYINGLQGSNIYGMESAILAIEGVRSVSVDEHFPPENFIYNQTVYIDDGTGGLTTDLKDKIETVIDGDGTEVNPGKRAGGVNVRVLPATVVPINIEVTCSIYRTEEEKANYDILEAIREEINSLKIQDDVVLTSLILRLRRISYVKDVSNLTINGAANNVAINVSQIARFNNLTLHLVNV